MVVTFGPKTKKTVKGSTNQSTIISATQVLLIQSAFLQGAYREYCT